jgi:DNA-binding transcriptional MerR regulator/methylmalonyl-CoA mutase cobalamin-binding subunit
MGEDPEPPTYSIRVASRLTGLSADTLRIWERRYGFPKPARNGARARVYTDADLERLLLVARALKAGFRASEVIHRGVEELQRLISSSAQAELQALRESPRISALLRALGEDDANAVRNGLRQAVATLGPRAFVLDLAAPLVEQVGEAWATGRLAVRHEHLLSEALSTQLRLLFSAYEPEARGPVFLLATLSNEQHGLGLEMAALYLALEGATPRLLGVDTPPDQIVEAARALGARVVGLSVSSSANADETLENVRWMLARSPESLEIWLGGRATADFEIGQRRLRCVPTWADVDRELERLHGAGAWLRR